MSRAIGIGSGQHLLGAGHGLAGSSIGTQQLGDQQFAELTAVMDPR